MKINEVILTELEEKVLDYFVVTSEISKTMSSIEELNATYVLDTNDVAVMGDLKKQTYLYQFYNIFLVKLITNIGLLYKLVKLQDTLLNAELEEKITNIIASDPDTMAVEGGKVVIIDEGLRDILENQLMPVSKEEIKEVKAVKSKAKAKPKTKPKDESGS